MPLLLTYALALLAAVLVSERARRTILSTAVLFLAVGIGFGALHGPAPRAVVSGVTEVALVAVLFTDGMRACLPDLRRAWQLPGRALLLGFPLTVAGTALAAHLLAGLPWAGALLLAAVLASTDPVFAAAIVGREEVPGPLRHLLNVESGLNDGLALPLVVGFLAWASHGPFDPARLALELAGGVTLGVAVPWVAVRLERTPHLGASDDYRPVGVFAVGLLTFALARAAHVNEYLAAFAAGVTLVTVAPRARPAFAPFAEVLTELLKLGALLVFGSVVSPGFLAQLPAGGWAFAIVALLAVRPAALGIALVRAPLGLPERAVAAWFGPKGFASVVYALLVESAGIPRGDLVFHLAAATVALSIVLHSSTDVPVVRWFAEHRPSGAPGGAPRRA